ncbi:MAG TPA: hypothetical protein VN841_15185 [Bryobacteraceae bacterium]|nr:hypothetical protein [Bryobacteraceae bacterium]
MCRRPAHTLILTALLACAGASAATRTCDGSMPVTSFRLSASPPDNQSQPNWVPLWHVNNLRAGYRIRYQPDDLPADMKNNAKLTLVMVPASPTGQITVLEPRAAATATEWQAPFTTRILLLVFAPQGLDEKRLTNLVTKDDVMASALADYADQTADLEASLDLIADLQDSAADARPRATTPAEQALFALVRALNPAVSGFDPLGAGRRAGPATLMGKGAAAFFENAGGLIPGGGGSVLPEVKTWLMPDTDFRSVYQVPAPNGGMSLCAKLQPRTRNKIAYLWAYRVISSPPVAVTAGLPVTHLPIGLRAAVPLKLDKPDDWRLLARVFDWTLTAEGDSGKPLPVAARPIVDERALQLDLRQFSGPPGTYRLEGKWDWGAVKLTGLVWLHRLEDLSAVHLTPESQDRLIASSGPVNIDLTGANLMFLDRAFLHRPSSSRQIPAELPEVRTTPIDPLPVEIDTDGLRPGPYLLALSRIDGATTDIPVRLLPPVPRIDTANARVHLGDREQTVTITGAGLDRIQNLETAGADLALQPAAEDSAKRGLTVRLHAEAKAGDRLTLLARVEGMTQAIRFPGVLQVTAARPVITEAKAALPREFTTAARGGLRDGELPAGSWANVSLRAAPSSSDANAGQPATPLPAAPLTVTVQCSDPQFTIQPITVHAGEKLTSAQLSSPAPGVLFLSLDPGAVGQSGCALTATVESEALGKSDPFPLGTVVRLPRIESLTLTDEKAPEGFYGALKGFDLDTIEKTGWDDHTGVTVAEAPQPLAGEGARQTLRISMPWPSPSPKAPLFIWLRGQTDGRPTGVSQ